MTTPMDNETEHIPIVKARAMLTKLPEQLSEENRAVALTRHGKPVLAVLPWELYESIIETMEIMSDPAMMAQLRKGIEDVQVGRVRPWSEVREELNVP